MIGSMNETETGEFIVDLLEGSIGAFLGLILTTIIGFFQEAWDLIVVNFFQKSTFLGAAPAVMGVVIIVIIGMRIAFAHVLGRWDK